jgi:hypothetical protein
VESTRTHSASHDFFPVEDEALEFLEPVQDRVSWSESSFCAGALAPEVPIVFRVGVDQASDRTVFGGDLRMTPAVCRHPETEMIHPDPRPMAGGMSRRPSESSQDGLLTRHAVSAEAGFSKAPD